MGKKEIFLKEEVGFIPKKKKKGTVKKDEKKKEQK